MALKYRKVSGGTGISGNVAAMSANTTMVKGGGDNAERWQQSRENVAKQRESTAVKKATDVKNTVAMLMCYGFSEGKDFGMSW